MGKHSAPPEHLARGVRSTTRHLSGSFEHQGADTIRLEAGQQAADTNRLEAADTNPLAGADTNPLEAADTNPLAGADTNPLEAADTNRLECSKGGFHLGTLGSG